MRWFRRRQQAEPTPEEHTAFSSQPWTVLVTSAMVTSHSQGIVVEASRRMVRALEASERSATELGRRIWWLTLWLLVFTAAIFLLTAVLVWTTLREARSDRGRTAAAAWVLWNASGSEGENRWRPVRGFTTHAECQHFADTMQKVPPGAIPMLDKGVEYVPPYTCLPDTVDPRGPKGSKT